MSNGEDHDVSPFTDPGVARFCPSTESLCEESRHVIQVWNGKSVVPR